MKVMRFVHGEFSDIKTPKGPSFGSILVESVIDGINTNKVRFESLWDHKGFRDTFVRKSPDVGN